MDDSVDITKILAIAYRRLVMFYAAQAQSLGIKYGLIMYLMAICDYPGYSQEQIATLLYVDKSTVAKAVKALLREGYITRAPNPNSRREYMLTPTGKGLALSENISRFKEKGHALITSRMTNIERDLFEQLLLKIPLK